jgi:hypothetical protein
MITSSSCGPPCWQSITPGKTTKQELLKILATLPFVEPESIEAVGQPWKIFNDVVNFSLTSKGNCEVYLINDIVVMIALNGNLGTTFDEGIRKLGKPQDLLVFNTMGPARLAGESQHTMVFALTPEDGVSIGYDAFYIREAWKNEIRPEINLSVAYYFDPAYYERLLEAGMFSMGLADAEKTLSLMQPWPGYGELPIQ